MEAYIDLTAVDAIRLLMLHPRQEGSEVRCTLQTTHLSAYPTYTALSYEWGEAENQSTITLNGRQVRVRVNLWRFLSRLSHMHNDRVLWVEAICINQDNISERNQQVQLMAQIYESASAVWKTYFTRMWIVQEVLLAKELVVYCGEHGVEWDALLEKCWGVRDVDSTLIRLAQARNRRKEHTSYDGYASLIGEFGSSECTDVRDKVYGLLGLFPESERLRVDYTVTLPVLFFRALSLFEEGRKVLSAECLRRSLGLAWPKLYSVAQSPSQTHYPFTSTDSPASIRILLDVAGSVREVERRRQPPSHGPGYGQTKSSQPRRRYFAFRCPHVVSDTKNHTYGLSTCRPLFGDLVAVDLELRGPAVIFRKTDSGKFAAIGGTATSVTLRDCLSLLAETPDHAGLAVLRDGLFSGVEATERSNGLLLNAKVTVRDLEGFLITATAK
ncbi:hypothetical protein ACJZ2D_016410 [Fusarium nematophilum]